MTNGQSLAQEWGGGGGRVGEVFGGARGDDAAAIRAGVRADFEEPIGGLQDVEVVLNHHDTVATVNEGLEDSEETFDVVAMQAGGRFVEQEQGSSCGRGLGGWGRGVGGGIGAEITNEFETLGFAAAEGVERLAEREVAEADGLEGAEARVDRGVVGEERECVGDGRCQEVGDGEVAPTDREDLGFEAAAFADRAGDKNIGEELHLDAFVAEALAVVAPAVAAVEGKGRGAEAGG